MPETFEYGDHVRHPRRPEWGVGTVTKTEPVVVEGERAQRLTIRFPQGGLKRLVTGRAELERVDPATLAGEAAEVEPAEGGFEALTKVDQNGWLGPVVRKRIEQTILALPESVRDPFLDLGRRLQETLRLYRFEPTGASLVEWAVAQTGLDDPLSHFSRQELEAWFARWATERDAHLERLLRDVRDSRPLLDDLVRSAPPQARAAVRRLTASR